MYTKRKLIAAFCSIVLLGGCTGYEDSETIDGVNYWINSFEKQAFAGECNWQVSDEPADITIQETVNKATVTKLGGFFGTGVPSPFSLVADADTYQFAGSEIYASEYGLPIVTKDVPITIHLPKTIEEVKYTQAPLYFGNLTEEGVVEFLHPQILIDCSDENQTFYSENGILYRKDDHSIIDFNDEKSNYDITIHKTLRDKLLGRYVLEVGDEQRVYEFFDANGKIYAHINYYTEGSEYMFSALEFTPVNAEVLDDDEADSFDATLGEFSDFSMGGQYVEPDEKDYHITVSEDDIILASSAESLTLKRDYSMPAQFPYRVSDMHIEVPDNLIHIEYGFNRLEKLLYHKYECDDYTMRIYCDGTLVVVMKHTDAPVIYRGIAQFFLNREEDKLLMQYTLTKTGGTAEPHEGFVQISYNDDSTVTFSAVDDVDGGPLLQETEQVIVAKQ